MIEEAAGIIAALLVAKGISSTAGPSLAGAGRLTAPSAGAAASLFAPTAGSAIGSTTHALAADKNGVWIEGGSGQVVKSLNIHGGDRDLIFAAPTSGVLVDSCNFTDPAHYGIYLQSALDQSLKNYGATIRNTNVTISKDGPGEHCIRIYASTNLTIDGGTWSNFGSYGGSPLNVRQVSNFAFRNLRCRGHAAGFGPQPSEPTYYVEDGVIEDCSFDQDQMMFFRPRARRLTFRRCSWIMRKPHEVLNVQTGASSINFEQCMFAGGDVLLRGNASAASFTGCTYEGRAL